MTCVPSDPRFRLLDHLVGWDAEHHDELIGLDDDDGVRLAGGPAGLGPEALDPFIPPPRLAPGCGPCEWYLATRHQPLSRLLKLDGCSNSWRPAWPRGCQPIAFENAVAIAVDRNRIAVADRDAGRVWVMRLKGAQITAEFEVDHPVDLSFGPSGQIVVATQDGAALEVFSTNGRWMGLWPAPLPETSIARIAHDRDARLWIAIQTETGGYRVYSQEICRTPALLLRGPEDLAAALTATTLVRSDTAGFCINRGTADGTMEALCWDWFGRALEPDCVGSIASGAFATQGQLLTRALDSGVPRCRWHRVLLDAEIPAGTRVEVSVTTDETSTSPPQPQSDPNWAGFPAGRPHPEDWQVISPGQTDALIQSPPGRYLFVRLRLSGDGAATPRVHRIHLDFPRATSANLLPAVFRDDPAASDFTERFLSLFDASLTTVDTAVSRFPALIDGAGAREEVLPWIASFLSVTLDDTWDAETRRRILRAAPDLYRRRGTRGGLIRSIQLAYGLSEAGEPSIAEHGLERQWGAIAGSGAPGLVDARLGQTRLYSRKSARLTLDASPIGQTPVLSFGDPAADPHRVGAFRFSVGLPASAGANAGALERLINGQKPAHTLATVRSGATTGFRLGGHLQLGIDTLVIRPKPQVLSDPNTRLSQNSILGGDPIVGPVLGRSALTDPRYSRAPSISCPE